MSIAVRIGTRGQKNSALFYINAVTRYDQSYRAQVSKYPLDSGVSISDHTVNENPVFTVSGIISPSDISFRAASAVVFDRGLDSPMNVDRNFPEKANSYVEDLLAGLKKYIPDVATQFLGTTSSEPKGGELPPDKTLDILSKIKTLFTSLIYNKANRSYRNSVVFCTLYEIWDYGTLRNSHRNLVLTDFKGSYDVENGTALLVEMTFEQVRVANIQQTEVPTNVSANISQETALRIQEIEDKGDKKAFSTLAEEGFSEDQRQKVINYDAAKVSKSLGW